MWTALVALLEKIRPAAESHGIKKVVVLTSLDRKLSDTRAPAFLQEALLTAWYGGPHVAQPPATVRSVPTKITPAALSKLRWPDHKTPTVLAVTDARRPDKTEINLTLLDAKEVFWHGTFALTAAEVAAIPAVPPVNQRILRFATDQRGQQVGDGECWTLADQALKAAGAQHPARTVWGRPLAAGERVFPGDIVQFSSVRLTHGSAWTTLRRSQPYGDHRARESAARVRSDSSEFRRQGGQRDDRGFIDEDRRDVYHLPAGAGEGP